MTRHAPSRLAAAALALALAACDPVTEPAGVGDTRPAPAQATRLECAGNLVARTVRCSAPTPSVGAARADILYGGQHQYVTILSDSVQVYADTFAFTIRVRNLIPQPIGTEDGVSAAPGGVRVFFDGPVVNTTLPANGGIVEVANADGVHPFTSAEPQAYFAYVGILPRGAESPARTWKLRFSPGVQSFSFGLYVSAPVPHPGGYVDVAESEATTFPGGTLALADTVRTAVGRPAPTGGVVAWSTSSAAVATVSPEGVVTGVAPGIAYVVATYGSSRDSARVEVVGGRNLALRFDGGDFARVADHPLLDLSGSWTIETWVKVVDPQFGWRAIVGKYSLAQADTNQYLMGISDGRLFAINTGPAGTTSQDAPDAFPVGSWHHVAWVMGADRRALLYVDGAPLPQLNDSWPIMYDTGNPLTLGAIPYRGSASVPYSYAYNLTGVMDEVRIWSVARTQAELLATRDRPLSGSEPGLVAYWDFNDGTGDPASRVNGFVAQRGTGASQPAYTLDAPPLQ